MEDLDQIKTKFIKAYDDLADKLFNHCFFKVSSREVAKDLVQETFTKSWHHVASGKEVLNLKAFLYKVANNLVIDHYRRTKDVSLDALREDGFDHSINGGEEIVVQAEHSRVLTVLKKLPKVHREVIIWRFVDGLTPKDIAAISGVSENVISVRLNRAMKKLRLKINPRKFF